MRRLWVRLDFVLTKEALFMTISGKTFISLFFLTALIFILFREVEFARVLVLLWEADLRFLTVATLSICAMLFISTLRFGFIINRLGMSQHWLSIHKINILSLLYSLLAMPLITQIAGRLVHSQENNKTLLAPVTMLEKSFSMTIMIAFAVIATWGFLNQSLIPPGALMAIGLIGATIFLTACSACFFIFDRGEMRHLLKAVLAIRHLGIVMTFFLSLIMHTLIILSYAILARQFLPDADLLKLSAAFTYVVLATSVPVGTGGWGVREISAGSSFALFGFPVEIGILAGFLYGTLHLMVLAGQALLLRRCAIKHPAGAPPGAGIDTVAFWPLCLAAVFLMIAFQIRMPLPGGTLTLNAVDLIALMVAINFLLITHMRGAVKTIWNDRLVWIGLAGFATMILIGWLVGYLSFGSNSWATTNRLLGMISIFSFLITGAALRHSVSHSWQFKFALLLGSALIISSLVQFAFNVPAGDIGTQYFNWNSNLSGFVGDRNAYAFMGLLAVFFLFHSDIRKQMTERNAPLVIAVGGILTGLVFFSGSRTGMAGIAIVVIWLGLIDVRLAIKVVILGIITNLIAAGASGIASEIAASNKTPIALMGGRTTPDRIFTLTEVRQNTWLVGWQLFIESPLFGAGLGAARMTISQVIHNLFLWILGEMGLVGMALCLPMGYVIMRQAFAPLKQKQYRALNMLVFCLIVGCFSMTQDIAYQRCLWLFLGYLLASSAPSPARN